MAHSMATIVAVLHVLALAINGCSSVVTAYANKYEIKVTDLPFSHNKYVRLWPLDGKGTIPNGEANRTLVLDVRGNVTNFHINDGRVPVCTLSKPQKQISIRCSESVSIQDVRDKFATGSKKNTIATSWIILESELGDESLDFLSGVTLTIFTVTTTQRIEVRYCLGFEFPKVHSNPTSPVSTTIVPSPTSSLPTSASQSPTQLTQEALTQSQMVVTDGGEPNHTETGSGIGPNVTAAFTTTSPTGSSSVGTGELLLTVTSIFIVAVVGVTILILWCGTRRFGISSRRTIRGGFKRKSKILSTQNLSQESSSPDLPQLTNTSPPTQVFPCHEKRPVLATETSQSVYPHPTEVAVGQSGGHDRHVDLQN